MRIWDFKTKSPLLTGIAFAIVIICFCALPTFGMRTHKLLDQIGPNDAMLLANPDGTVILSKNADRLRTPASTLKILTALAAIHVLGDDYCFKTEFYLDKGQNLVIKGYGDPFLVSERVESISGRLAKKISSINDILIDDTFMDRPVRVPGAGRHSFQPYDAPNGALCVNFNTVYYKQVHGKYVSAEPQTPLLPMALKRIPKNGPACGRILLTSDGDEAAIYAGELFAFFLRKNGVRISGHVRRGTTGHSSERHVLTACSPPLTGIIQKTFQYSNNFMANQMMLATGARQYGPPATLEKGVHAISEFSKSELGIHPILAEGSGISRKNRISASMFLKVLMGMRPYHRLLKHEGRAFFKTGTLANVRNIAGYIKGKDGLYPFVIFINTPGGKTDGIFKNLKRLVPE